MNFIDTRAATAPSGPATMTGQKVINLALQGGGSHGAFTWGVLDRLLEDERIAVEGISATSSGAINAVVFADGLAAGGREGARAALRQFWKRLSEIATSGIFQPSPLDRISPDFGLDRSPGYLFIDALSYFFSPYLLNPLDYNPLRDLLEELVDFKRLREVRPVKLFLCATNVRTGKVKVFGSEDICAPHVLASTCLPLLMRPVEIDGEHYWDGGFSGNPAIFPVIYECDARDIIMVHVTPADRPDLPATSHAAMNRIQEIAFNSSLIREMRAITFVTRLIDDGQYSDGKRILMHVIEAEDVTRQLSNSSKLNGDWSLLSYLYTIGRERADKWLKCHFDSLGVKSTVDLEAKYF